MTTPPAAAPESPKIDAIFQSMKDGSGSGGAPSISARQLMPFGLVVIACVLAYVAVTYWHRKRAAPNALRNHRKLMAEAARLTPGVSKRQMKALTSLATSAGMSSPLVALICPSAIGRLAGQIREDRQRTALRAVAEGLVRAQKEAIGAAKGRAA